MAEALLTGASVGTGNLFQVNGVAMLVGHRLCISKIIKKARYIRTARNWVAVNVMTFPRLGVINLISGRAPPTICINDPIAITPIISVDGDLSFGGKSWV